ncbi:hypothetical protein PVK06_010041 [Gossypium arboreum]|uniref:Uncharacterized protein n=1 Tax=Gossypium arboreum TaxID=29729 RepID=A0ABR0QQH5_GOSAR|nr:hypothetical protein PVK06_010041 [Gossypium arboreum]
MTMIQGGVLSLIKHESGLLAAIEDLQEENKYQVNNRKGNHVDCGDESDEGVDSSKFETLQISPIYYTLRDLIDLQDEDIDAFSFRSAVIVDNAFSPRIGYLPPTNEANPEVEVSLNLEKQDTELEACILLSLPEPSFRKWLEPSGETDTTITPGPSDNKITRHEPGSKSKWKKKIKDAIAKVTNSWSAKKQQQEAPYIDVVLYEIDAKGVLKTRWEDEKKRHAKSKRRPTSCICCPKISRIRDFVLEDYV